MKKKQPRYDRSNGSATAANDDALSKLGEGDSSAVMGGGGRDTPSNETTTNDNHHNLSTPCCNLLAAIASEIFPSTANHAPAAGSSNDVTPATPTPTTTPTTTCDEQSKNQQPLFGRMILNHLLNERERTREDQHYCSSEGGAALDSPGDILSLLGSSSLYTNKKKGRKKKKKKKKGSIDCCDTMKDESTAISANGTTFLVFGGGGGGESMENRNIESFAMYLKNKFEQHQKQYDKSRGGGSYSSSRSKTSSISSSSSPPATATSTAPVVRGGVDYKDILPTVSISKANELSQYINCRKCRTSTIGALRNMTARNEFSLTLCEDKNTNNTRTTMLNNHHYHHHNSSSSSSSSSSTTLRLAVPISGISRSSVHDDIDLAFSYVNMDDFDLEAGHSSSSSSSSVLTTNGRMIDESIFQLELRTIGSASDKDRYLQIGCLLPSRTTTSSTNTTTTTTTTTTTESCDTNVNDSIDCSFPLCTDTIINLIKQIILPCGLVEAVGTDGFGENDPKQQQLDNAELAAIAKEACDHVDGFQAFFANADTSILQMEEVMDRAIEKDTERSVFSPIVWKLLQEGDEKCNDLSRQLATLMMNVFKLSCFVGWSARSGDAIIAYVKRLWDMYLKRLIQLSTLTSTYHTRLLKMSNGGAIQQVYSNKAARDLLLQLVGNKVDMFKELILDLKSSLFGEEDSTNSVVELCVLRAYRNHVGRLGSELDEIFIDQENEDMIKELITAQINISQRTHYSPCADDLKQNATDQRNEIINLSRTVRTSIILMEDLAVMSKYNFLGIHYTMSQETYYDISHEIDLLPSCQTNGGDIDERIDDSPLLLKQSNALIMQMLVVLTSRQCNESLMGSLDIPLRLEPWADDVVERAKYYDIFKGDMKGTITSYFPDDSKGLLDNCDGGSQGGMRRISSIFAGLVYRWLEVRCSEWHAELTRDELLESMDMEVSAVTAEGGNKGSSSKKKKNHKTGGGDKGKQRDEQPSIPATVSNSIPVIDNVIDATISPIPSSTPHIDSIPIDHDPSGDLSIDEEIKDNEHLVKYPQFSGQDTAQLSGGKIGVNNTVDDNDATTVKSNTTKDESSEVSLAVIEKATTKCIKKKKSNRNKKKEEQDIISNVAVSSSTTANVVTPSSSSSSNGHIRSFDGVPLDGFIDPEQEEYVKGLMNKFEQSSAMHQNSNNIFFTDDDDVEPTKVMSMDVKIPATAFKVSKMYSSSKSGGSNKDTNANNQVSIATPLSSPTPASNSKASDYHNAKIAFSAEKTKKDDDSIQIPAVRQRKRNRRKKNKGGNIENNVEINATSNRVLNTTKFECKPSVGVVDGDTFIPAETYLVNRLQKILEEMDYMLC